MTNETFEGGPAPAGDVVGEGDESEVSEVSEISEDLGGSDVGGEDVNDKVIVEVNDG